MTIQSLVSSKIAKAIAIGLIVAGVIAPMAAVVATGVAQPRDNNANSIMWGGAYSKTEWLQKMTAGDGHNTAANLQQIMFSENRSITQDNFMSADTVDGEVHSDGNVIVAGKVVANQAMSTGRNFVAGSVKDGSVWIRPTSAVFLSPSIPAFVNMSSGQFHYAVIKSCGNPVRATSVVTAHPMGHITKQVINLTQQPSAAPADADDIAHAVAVKPGDSVKYLVNVSNTGGADMTNVVYTDDLPAGVNLADPAKRHIEHNLGTIKPGTVVVADITVTVVPGKTTAQAITNKACFTSAESQTGCDVAVISVTVAPTPSPSPSVSPTPSASPTATPSATPRPSATPSATPSPTPSATPSPTPSPTSSSTPSPTPSATPVPSATPSATPAPSPSPVVEQPGVTCASFTAKQVGGADSHTFQFNIVPTTSASVTGFAFDFGDNSTKETGATESMVEHTYASAGTFFATGRIRTAMGVTPEDPKCSVQLSFESTATPLPSPSNTPSPTPAPVVLGASNELPATGPEGALAGLGGLGAIAFASRAYLRSRKSLLSAMKQNRNL